MSDTRFNTIEFLDRWVYLWTLAFLVSLTFSMALMEISFVAAFIGWIALKAKKRTPLPFERKTFGALLAFVLLSILSFFWSEYPKESFRGIFKILQQFFLFWIVAETLETPERQKRTLQVLSYLFLFLGIDGMWQHIFGVDLLRGISFEPASSGPRISATFHNYGLLACFIVSFLPVLACQLRKGPGTGFLFQAAFGVVFGILLLFWTRLRGAWLALLGGIVFFLWFSKKRIYLAFLIPAFMVGFLFLPRSMIIHLDQYGKEQSLVERFYLWDRAVQVIRARPWTGTGINTYTVAHSKYDQRQNWRVRNYYSHNGYLQIAAETGLPSLVCFLAFLFFYFKRALLLLKGSEDRIGGGTLIGILTGIVNFLLLGAADTIFHNPQAVLGFWFLAGWGTACQGSRQDPLSFGRRGQHFVLQRESRTP